MPSHKIIHLQGSTLEKKPWGQLAPKFLDLVASTDFLVAKNFRPFGPKTFTWNFRSTNCLHRLPRRKSKDEKPYVKKNLNVAIVSLFFIDQLLKRY